jgi:Leucine-rich repeat (LRR) protein
MLLEFLDLSNNSFHSTVPTELGLLTNLQFLNLEQNHFNGTIPSEIGALQYLGT